MDSVMSVLFFTNTAPVKLTGWTQPVLFISHYNIERNNNCVTAYTWPEMSITPPTGCAPSRGMSINGTTLQIVDESLFIG